MPLLESIISTLSSARKEKILDVAFAHAAEVSYFRLRRKGFRPNGIIDIGAYEGNWTRLARTIFPNVPTLMIEAQSEKRNSLDSVKSDLDFVDYVCCLLGRTDGAELIFNVMETGSSIYSELSNVPRVQRTIKSRTLDKVVEEKLDLKGPLFIKLDVQGAELDVLAGGENVLRASEVVQLEVALASYNEGAPMARDVFEFMADRNFLIFDICGFVRPKQSDLVQIDVLFVKENSKLRQNLFRF